MQEPDVVLCILVPPVSAVHMVLFSCGSCFLRFCAWSGVGLLILYIKQEDAGRRIFILSVVVDVVVVVFVKHTEKDNHVPCSTHRSSV